MLVAQLATLPNKITLKEKIKETSEGTLRNYLTKWAMSQT